MAKAELQNWINRLSVAHRKHDAVKKDTERFKRYYRGDQWESKDGYNDYTVDNMVFANTRIILPRLNFRNPKIFLTPRKKPYRDDKGMIYNTLAAAASFELLLNYYYAELKAKREARRCLVDALLGHWGVMQLGYTLKTEKIKDDELLDVNELIREDSPFLMRRSPNSLRVDPEATDHHLNDARWIALEWVKSLEDLKADGRYSGLRGLQPNFRIKTEFGSSADKRPDVSDAEDTELWGRIRGWDVWDRKTRRFMSIVGNHDKFLRNDKEWPLDLEGFPVEILYFNENPDELYPLPDVKIYIDAQDELNRIASLQLSHIKRLSQRKYANVEGSMDEEEKQKLKTGPDGTIVDIKGDPDKLKPIQDASISQDIYIVRQQQKRSIREMAGISDMEAMESKKYDQATEPALINQAVMTIREDQRDIFEDFIIRNVRKLAQILQQTFETRSIPLNIEQFAQARAEIPHKLEKIIGGEGAAVILPWLSLSKEDIQGEFDFSMEIGSTQPINQEMRKRDSATLYKIFTESQNPYIEIREQTRDILEAFGKQDPDKYLKSDEQVAQLMQGQVQGQVQAEVAKVMPKIQADLEKTKMKSAVQREGNILKAQSEKGKVTASLLQAMLKPEKKAGGE